MRKNIYEELLSRAKNPKTVVEQDKAEGITLQLSERVRDRFERISRVARGEIEEDEHSAEDIPYVRRLINHHLDVIEECLKTIEAQGRKYTPRSEGEWP